MSQLLTRIRVSAVAALFLIVGTASSFAQKETVWSTASDVKVGATGVLTGTVTSLDTARRAFVVRLDQSEATLRVTTDVVATNFRGFTTGERSDVFHGRDAFARLRSGDRVQVKGIAGSSTSIAATDISLLGRPAVSVPSTTTAPPTTAQSATLPSDVRRVQGTVRSIIRTENRIVIENDARQLYTVVGSDSTPVYFEGGTYRISNIEEGDTIRVEVDTTSRNEVRARWIDVIASVSHGGTGQSGTRTVTSVIGKVISVDARARTLRVDDERGREVRVDLVRAEDVNGRPIRATDIQRGDRIEVTGRWNGDVLEAETVRIGDITPAPPRGDRDDVFDRGRVDLEVVVLYGTVDAELDDSVLQVRDDDERKVVRVWADEDLVVRTRTGEYIAAQQLRERDRVVIRAFRDRDGNLIAQTIRLR